MKIRTKYKTLIAKIKDTRLGQIWDSLKAPFNFCWKAGAVVFLVVVSICLLEGAWNKCSNYFGLKHYYWCDEDLTENIEIQRFSNNQVATYNKITDQRMSPKVRWISCVPDRDSLTVFCDKEGKRGFLNVNTGKVVISGQYKRAWHFSEGLAAVVGENGKVSFINYDNELVIPMQYDYVEDFDYLFVRGHCVMRDSESGNLGVIDRSGNVVLPFEYTDIFEASESEDTWYVKKRRKMRVARF